MSHYVVDCTSIDPFVGLRVERQPIHDHIVDGQPKYVEPDPHFCRDERRAGPRGHAPAL